MSPLPTVVLHHTSRNGGHFDWLIALPPWLDGGEQLWTCRTMVHPAHWSAAGRLILEPLGLHRRHYLTFQGPIGGGRGSVVRVDQGHIIPQLWTDHRIVLTVQSVFIHGSIDIRLEHGGPAVARVTEQQRV